MKDDWGKTESIPHIRGMGMTLLLAACLCAAGVILSELYPAVSPNTSKKPSASNPTQSTNAEQYLESLPWEKKSHNALKPLTKIKNLRYALDFIQKYTAAEISVLPAASGTLEGIYRDFSKDAGKLISVQASVVRKYPIAEEIELGSDAPSTLLGLDAAGTKITASMLVVGSSLDDLKAGDIIRFICIPLYCFAPESGDGGLLLVTLPELIYKS